MRKLVREAVQFQIEPLIEKKSNRWFCSTKKRLVTAFAW